MSGRRLTGVIVPLVTPFHGDGSINAAALEALIHMLIGAGVHGVFAAGTTGEGPLLQEAEWRLVAETAVRAAQGRVPVIVQAGAITTTESIARARHAQACGADAAAVLCPYYYRLDEAALIEHFCAVAASVPDYPIYLYNIPQCTGNSISAAVTTAVAERSPNVVGEKDSSGDLRLIAAKQRIQNGDFQVLIGNDGLILSALAQGVRGAVSGNANVVPELLVALFDTFRRGDLPGAQAAQERIDRVRVATRDGGDLSLFKGLLGYRGIAAGPVRPPLRGASQAEVTACRAALVAEGS